MNSKEEKIKEHKSEMLKRANTCLSIIARNGIEGAYISHLCLDKIEVGLSEWKGKAVEWSIRDIYSRWHDIKAVGFHSMSGLYVWFNVPEFVKSELVIPWNNNEL